jgi:branched-chain amino acid aminotransferase
LTAVGFLTDFAPAGSLSADHPMSADDGLANINGTITPLAEAVIPATDHGFLYGDSVYETIRTYGHRPFLIAEHLRRLHRSAAGIRLPLPWTDAHLSGEIGRTLERAAPRGEYGVRVVATRGAGPLGYDPALCPRPNLAILVSRLVEPSSQQRAEGIAAAVTRVRRNPIAAQDPRIKSSCLLNCVLAGQEAALVGATEGIMLNIEGHVAEGTTTNVFFVSRGTLRTPSLECGILGGVTRDLVIELARQASIPCEEGAWPGSELSEASEIFVTSTTREILAVGTLDGRPVGSGVRGPIATGLHDLFQRRVEAFLKSS